MSTAKTIECRIAIGAPDVARTVMERPKDCGTTYDSAAENSAKRSKPRRRNSQKGEDSPLENENDDSRVRKRPRLRSLRNSPAGEPLPTV
jgi:hypothetical protein